MKEVRFVVGVPPYQAGETASFSVSQSDEYIRAGLAVEPNKDTEKPKSTKVENPDKEAVTIDEHKEPPAEPKHTGGGWYDVPGLDEHVRGKDEAYRKWREVWGIEDEE